MNFGDSNIYPDPQTVSADSLLPIEGLEWDGNSFAAGDCFEFDFTNPVSYGQQAGNTYVPIPGALTTCDFVPAATCVLDTTRPNFLVKVTLNAGSEFDVNGKFGPIKNPYSVLSADGLKLNVRFYQGCSSSTPTAQSTS